MTPSFLGTIAEFRRDRFSFPSNITRKLVITTVALAIGGSFLPAIARGAISDRRAVGYNLEALSFAGPNVGYGPNLFYFLRRDPHIFMFGTISPIGAVIDRMGVGGNLDALTFGAPNVGYGTNLFYYLRHDPGNFSTFGSISTLGIILNRFGVGFDFNALTFAAVDVGYGPNLFYYLRHDANGWCTFGTFSPSAARMDRFGVGYDFRALAFAAADVGYGPNLFYYIRRDAGGFAFFGTIAPSGAIIDRLRLGYDFDAITFAEPDLGYGSNLFYYLRHDAGGASIFGTIETPPQRIGHLVNQVLGCNLPRGIATSLLAKLAAAKTAVGDLDPGNDIAAVNILSSFIHFVEAQRGKGIPESVAPSLLAQTELIIGQLLLELPGLDKAHHRTQATTYAFTTLAGLSGTTGTTDGIGSAARFTQTNAVTIAADGSLFVGDVYAIRHVNLTGVVTTFAPIGAWSLAIDSGGNLFLPGGMASIYKVTSTGAIGVFAGRDAVFGSTDGTGTNARFYMPAATATDAANNVFVSDTGNHTIRRITPAGVVTTFAGVAGALGNADGPVASARFHYPFAIAVTKAGDLYIADRGNQTIRKISGGIVTTVAGSSGQIGSADGAGLSSRFYNPVGVAVDAYGNVFVADRDNNTIRRINPAGIVSTIGGFAGLRGSTDGVGSAARFWSPCSVAVDSTGTLFIADTLNHTIRKGVPQEN